MNYIHRLTVICHEIYLVTGLTSILDLTVAGVPHDVAYTVYQISFVVYVLLHVLGDLLPKLIKLIRGRM